MKILNIAVLGLGTVGSNAIKLLKSNTDEILSKNGVRINIVKIMDKNSDRFDELGLDKKLFCSDIQEICKSKAEVVVELIGGLHPAKEFIEQALAAKKHVVTANKDLICTFGKQLIRTAANNGCSIYFEASCLGAVPVINTLCNNFAGDRLISVKGIFNGTTNYILTKMKQDGTSFEEALKKAQELGYAESNPSNDIKGVDAAYKACILARVAFGLDTALKDVTLQGIDGINSQDIAVAARLGYTIKLLATSKMNNNKELELRVNPCFVPNTHQLSKIDGAINAITVEGNFSGEVTLTGFGAGGKPTASAVVNDIIAVAAVRKPKADAFKAPAIAQDWNTKFYLRLTVSDNPGTLAKIAGCLSENQISIEYCLQDKHESDDKKTLVILTHETSYLKMQKSLAILSKMNTVVSTDSVIEVI